MAMIDFGVEPSNFADDYLEKQCLLQRGAVAERVFGWADFDAILYSVEPGAPSLQLFLDGLVDESEFTEPAVEFGARRNRFDKARFLRLLHQGATLVLNRFENYSLTVRRLCDEIGRFAGSQPVSNAYLSLGGRGTFGRHWDTHDVFVLQLIGRKRWQVFEPTFELPLPGQSSTGREAECPDKPLLDVVLEEGDLLYLPRGFWHHAIPVDGPSLHLSVGLYGPTVRDYLAWVCTNLLGNAIDARRTLHATAGTVDVVPALKRLCEAATDGATLAAFETDVCRREPPPPRFNTDLFFRSGAAALEENSVIALNRFRRVKTGRDERDRLNVNKRDPRSAAIARAIVDVLSVQSPATLGALCAALPAEKSEVIRVAVLDLELHEIVNVTRP